MRDDSYFMGVANREAQKALKRGDYPCGCVIVKNGEIVSKTSSMGITKNDATAHAEIIAVKHASKKLKSRFLEGCTVYTNIEPCLMCAIAIVYAGIKKVVYGTEHKEYGNRKTFDILKRNGIAKDMKIISGLQKEKALELFEKFLSNHPNFL